MPAIVVLVPELPTDNEELAAMARLCMFLPHRGDPRTPKLEHPTWLAAYNARRHELRGEDASFDSDAQKVPRRVGTVVM